MEICYLEYVKVCEEGKQRVADNINKIENKDNLIYRLLDTYIIFLTNEKVNYRTFCTTIVIYYMDKNI